MKTKHTYTVLQGKLRVHSSNGNLNVIAKFTSKKDAMKKFNEVKRDARGWANDKNDYLHTEIIEDFNDEDENFETIASFDLDFKTGKEIKGFFMFQEYGTI